MRLRQFLSNKQERKTKNENKIINERKNQVNLARAIVLGDVANRWRNRQRVRSHSWRKYAELLEGRKMILEWDKLTVEDVKALNEIAEQTCGFEITCL